jgi:hypothetical protein
VRRDFFDQSIAQQFACHFVAGAAFAVGREFREFASANSAKRAHDARFQERGIRTRISLFSCRAGNLAPSRKSQPGETLWSAVPAWSGRGFVAGAGKLW